LQYLQQSRTRSGVLLVDQPMQAMPEVGP